MKHILLSICLSICWLAFSQQLPKETNSMDCNYQDVFSNIDGDRMSCASADLEYYLKRPPIFSQFILTEDRNEKVEVVLKDIHDFTDIRVVYGQFFDATGWEYIEYPMYDNGTNGDEIANDKTFTNDAMLINFNPTTSYRHNIDQLSVLYFEGGVEVHRDDFNPDFISVSADLLDEIEIPNYYEFENKDYLFTDTFIYYNKYDNWPEIECNQFGGTIDASYVISKSLLWDYWEESLIDDPTDKDLYMQVDFIQPGGQFQFGQDIALFANSLQGVELHEILHFWVPNINPYLGYASLDDHNGHHPNVFQNTSGFLYSSWSRLNGIYCDDTLSTAGQDANGDFVFVDTSNNYELCNGSVANNMEKQTFNDYELYLMNLISIDEVNTPLSSLVNVYDIVPDTGGETHYFDSILEIDSNQLEAARTAMLSDFGNPEYMDASVPNNFILTFSGNTSNLTNDEIKMLWILSHDLSTTGDKYLDYYPSATFYQATGERAEITANIPLPTAYTGTFFTFEHISINAGEDYNGWTESGEYERTLNSMQYNDSIVTTFLTVEDELSTTSYEKPQIRLYPNPSHSTVFIDFEGFQSYTLYNTLGQTIDASGLKRIEVSHLKSGLYFVEVRGNSNLTQTVQLIVN